MFLEKKEMNIPGMSWKEGTKDYVIKMIAKTVCKFMKKTFKKKKKKKQLGVQIP